MAAVFLLIATQPGLAQERLENATAGFSLEVPPTWTVSSVDAVMTNRAQVRLPDRELELGIQRSTAPLFVINKYPEPHPSLNPSVQIVLRPKPASLGNSPTEMLRVATLTLRRAFPDFRFVEPIRDTEVSGFKAAYMRATYTLTTRDGRSFQVMARTWVVPRGSVMFLIGMSGAVTGTDVCETEFAATLRSIQMER